MEIYENFSKNKKNVRRKNARINVGTITCDVGYFAAAGQAPDVVSCDRGSWSSRTLVCEQLDCGVFPALSAAYTITPDVRTYGPTHRIRTVIESKDQRDAWLSAVDGLVDMCNECNGSS